MFNVDGGKFIVNSFRAKPETDPLLASESSVERLPYSYSYPILPLHRPLQYTPTPTPTPLPVLLLQLLLPLRRSHCLMLLLLLLLRLL